MEAAIAQPVRVTVNTLHNILMAIVVWDAHRRTSIRRVMCIGLNKLDLPLPSHHPLQMWPILQPIHDFAKQCPGYGYHETHPASSLSAAEFAQIVLAWGLPRVGGVRFLAGDLPHTIVPLLETHIDIHQVSSKTLLKPPQVHNMFPLQSPFLH